MFNLKQTLTVRMSGSKLVLSSPVRQVLSLQVSLILHHPSLRLFLFRRNWLTVETLLLSGLSHHHNNFKAPFCHLLFPSTVAIIDTSSRRLYIMQCTNGLLLHHIIMNPLSSLHMHGLGFY